MNKLEDDILTDVEDVLGRTTDDFGFTLTGNPIKSESIKELQARIENAHKRAVQAIRNSDPNATAIEQEDIALKRCSFWEVKMTVRVTGKDYKIIGWLNDKTNNLF